MASIREKLNGFTPGASGTEVEGFADKSKHKGSTIGATMQKRMLAFVPASGNQAFNGGRGKSFSYAFLYSIDFSRDYTELALSFSGHQVVVTGRNLKAKLDNIEAFREELVEEVDELTASGMDADACVVTRAGAGGRTGRGVGGTLEEATGRGERANASARRDFRGRKLGD